MLKLTTVSENCIHRMNNFIYRNSFLGRMVNGWENGDSGSITYICLISLLLRQLLLAVFRMK